MVHTFYSQKYDLMSYRKHLFPHPVTFTYDKAAIELINILHSNEALENKIKYLEEFTQKFTSGHEIWQEWYMLQLEKVQKEGTYEDKKDELGVKRFLSFCENFPVPYRLPYHNTSSEFALRAQLNRYIVFLKTLIENDFNYESNMFSICDTFWNLSSAAVSLPFQLFWFQINITNYTSMKNLPIIEQFLNINYKIERLQSKEKNSKRVRKYKWIKALNETESAEYIIKNIEADMAYNNRTSELKFKFKLLFHYSHNYIKEANGDEKSLINLLEVYRRYCRYFVDDLITRKKYQRKTTKTSRLFNNSKWVLDLIKLEYGFGLKKDAEEQLNKFAEERTIDTKIFSNYFMENFKLIQQLVSKNELLQSKIYFTKNDLLLQNFEFPSPLIKYLCKNANYEITQKLQKSSKQLFLIINKTQCFKFSISDLEETEYYQESLFVSAKNPQIDHIKNICIFNTLFVSFKNERILSKFIPKIRSCNIQFLLIGYQTLTVKEYNFLTNSKNIKRIALDNSIVTNMNGEKTSLEQLLENLPNAENIGFIPSPLITSDTFLTLHNCKRNAKMHSLHLSQIKEEIIPADLCLFLKIYAANNSQITICSEIENNIQNLMPSIKNMLDSWKPLSEQPKIELRHGE